MSYFMGDPEDFSPASSIAEISYDDAMLAGSLRPHAAWVSSDWDVLYANPYYKGPPRCHPECGCEGAGPRPGCLTNPPLPQVPETLLELVDRVLAPKVDESEIPF